MLSVIGWFALLSVEYGFSYRLAFLLFIAPFLHLSSIPYLYERLSISERFYQSHKAVRAGKNLKTAA